MTELDVRRGQVLPADFAETLLSLKGTPHRLDTVLREASLQGWTRAALAEPLGLTRQRVGQRIAKAQGRLARAEDLKIPAPPAMPVEVPAAPKPAVRLIDPAVVEQLLGMYATARTVNGCMSEDHPARAVSVEFAARLQQLVDDGFTVYRIAKCLGLSHQAIYSRLARHGYRAPSPSQVYAEYRGTRSRRSGSKKAGAR